MYGGSGWGKRRVLGCARFWTWYDTITPNYLSSLPGDMEIDKDLYMFPRNSL
jgi:hypothetical protein